MKEIMKFSINYDYRCPFARNLNEHVVTALAAGANFEVNFVPFNLSQVHVEEHAEPIWDDPSRESDLLANEVGYIVSKLFPEKFLQSHIDIFSLRHDKGKTLRDFDDIATVLEYRGIDANTVKAELDAKSFSTEVRKLHEAQVNDLEIFGVPTIFDDKTAAFVRIMTRPDRDPARSIDLVKRAVDHVFTFSIFNEIKHTSIER